jgi:hypothetical protein
MALVQLVQARRASEHVLWTGLSIVLFFTVLAVANAMLLPVCVGLGLCVLHEYVRRAASGS